MPGVKNRAARLYFLFVSGRRIDNRVLLPSSSALSRGNAEFASWSFFFASESSHAASRCAFADLPAGGQGSMERGVASHQVGPSVFGFRP